MSRQDGVYVLPMKKSRLCFIHDSFPPSLKLGSPRAWQNKAANTEPSNILHGARNDRKLSVSLPSLPFNNFQQTPWKDKKCPFVDNQKKYLRRKGFQIDDVYSLRCRRKLGDGNNLTKSLEDIHLHSSKDLTTGTNELPPISTAAKSPRDKKWQWQAIQEEVWLPEMSRKIHSRGLRAFNERLDRELKGSGSVRLNEVKSPRLEKVHTPAKLGYMLQENKMTKSSTFD